LNSSYFPLRAAWDAECAAKEVMIRGQELTFKDTKSEKKQKEETV